MLVGMEGQIGCIRPQAFADSVVVDGNPSDNIKNLWRVEEVFLAGNRVDRGPGEFLSSLRQHPPVSGSENVAPTESKVLQTG